MLVGVGDEVGEVLVVGREQHQCAETGGADGIALGHRLGGIADGVERIGRFAHLFGQSGHLGDAAGIVGDRPKGVERDHDAGERQHRRHRNGDAEQAGKVIAHEDAGDDDERRQRRRLHRHGKALDHVGAVTGHRGPRDRLHRPIIGAGEVFGDPDDQSGHYEADDAAIKQLRARIAYAGERTETDQVINHRRDAD